MTELTDKETIIRSDINTVVAKYTEEEFNADGQKAVKGGDFIQDAGSVRIRLHRGREFLKRGNGKHTRIRH